MIRSAREFQNDHVASSAFGSRFFQKKNDTDVNPLRAPEDAIEDYGGCTVIISHNRWIPFLARAADAHAG